MEIYRVMCKNININIKEIMGEGNDKKYIYQGGRNRKRGRRQNFVVLSY